MNLTNILRRKTTGKCIQRDHNYIKSTFLKKISKILFRDCYTCSKKSRETRMVTTKLDLVTILGKEDDAMGGGTQWASKNH